MKTKLYILSIALCLFFLPKAQANHAFYVYQNTGAIDAFFTYEVDSIRYSNLDLDSVWHATSQVQEIWTKDSTYRVPLENIDSVSFITPETVYTDGRSRDLPFLFVAKLKTSTYQVNKRTKNWIKIKYLNHDYINYFLLIQWSFLLFYIYS